MFLLIRRYGRDSEPTSLTFRQTVLTQESQTEVQDDSRFLDRLVTLETEGFEVEIRDEKGSINCAFAVRAWDEVWVWLLVAPAESVRKEGGL